MNMNTTQAIVSKKLYCRPQAKPLFLKGMNLMASLSTLDGGIDELDDLGEWG